MIIIYNYVSFRIIVDSNKIEIFRIMFLINLKSNSKKERIFGMLFF